MSRSIQRQFKLFLLGKFAVIFVVVAVMAFQTLPIYFASIAPDETYVRELAALVNQGQPNTTNAWSDLVNLVREFDTLVKQTRQREWTHYNEFVGDFDFSNLLAPELSRTKFEREYAAMEALEERGIFERLEPILGETRLNKWEVEPVAYLDSAPELTPVRRLGRALCARMRFHADEGDIERIPADFAIAMWLAAVIEQQTLMLHELVGMSIEAQAMTELGHLLQEHRLNDEILNKLDAALRSRTDVRSIVPVVRGERCVTFTTIQTVFTQNAQGEGYLLPDAMSGLTGEVSSRTVFDAIASRYRLPTRRQVVDLVDQWYTANIAAAEAGDPRKFPHQPKSASSPAEALAHILTSEFGTLADSVRYRAAHARGLRLLIAARRVMNADGEFPSSVDELCQHGELSAVFPGSTEPIRYRVDRDQAGQESVFMWWVGKNGMDDAGERDDYLLVAPRGFVHD